MLQARVVSNAHALQSAGDRNKMRSAYCPSSAPGESALSAQRACRNYGAVPVSITLCRKPPCLEALKACQPAS
jgi:hypothetical protein